MDEKTIRKIIIEEQRTFLPQIKEQVKQLFFDFGREMRDFVRQEISASETRVKTEIIEAVIDIVDNGIHPQIDNHENRITKIENRLLTN